MAFIGIMATLIQIISIVKNYKIRNMPLRCSMLPNMNDAIHHRGYTDDIRNKFVLYQSIDIGLLVYGQK
jgi:hypothetical protein